MTASPLACFFFLAIVISSEVHFDKPTRRWYNNICEVSCYYPLGKLIWNACGVGSTVGVFYFNQRCLLLFQFPQFFADFEAYAKFYRVNFVPN